MHIKKRVSVFASFILLLSSLSVGCSSTSTSSDSEVNSSDVMSNLSARKAIIMAIDKNGFIDTILNDGSVEADYFVPSQLALDNEDRDYRDIVGNLAYEEDDEKAKLEWEKAKEEIGFDKVELELVLSDTDMHKKLGEYIQSELTILEGMTVTIKQMPAKQVFDSQDKGDFDISMSGWGPDYPDPLTYLDTFSKGQVFAKATGYDNQEFNDLLSKGKNSKTTDEAWESYSKAEKILIEDAYLSPVYQKGITYLEKDYVKDIGVANFGPKYSYKWSDVEKESKVLNVSNNADITTLDGSKIQDTLSREVTLNVMESLVRLDNDLKVVPGIAKDWTVSEDGLKWTFKLRDDALWSNGEKITAEDFEYSFKRTLDPETKGENSAVFFDIVGAEDFNLGKNTDRDSVGVNAIDENTLEIELVRPVPYFDRLMCHPIFAPQNQAFIEDKGDAYGTSVENTLFSGPFILSKWKMEDQYTMEKNPYYWDKESVKLDIINTKIVKDNNAALNLYEAGEIDRVNLTAEQVDKYKDSKELGTIIDSNTYSLLFNVKNHN